MKPVISATLSAPAFAIATFTIPMTIATTVYYGNSQLQHGLIFALFALLFVYPPALIASPILTFIHKRNPFNIWKVLPLTGMTIMATLMTLTTTFYWPLTIAGTIIGALTGLIAAWKITRNCPVLSQLS